jgi:hypothetical protein
MLGSSAGEKKTMYAINICLGALANECYEGFATLDEAKAYLAKFAHYVYAEIVDDDDNTVYSTDPE